MESSLKVIGRRTNGIDLEVEFYRDEASEFPRPLPLRLDEYNGSPTGFECGYSGAGPTQLTFCLLREIGVEVEEAKAVCCSVRDVLVRNLPRDRMWILTEDDIKDAFVRVAGPNAVSLAPPASSAPLHQNMVFNHARLTEIYEEERAKAAVKFPKVMEYTLRLNRRFKGGTLGRCNYLRKTVELSLRDLRANGVEHPQVRDTIRHELAHAAVGAGYGHGQVWKSVARILGANPRSTMQKRAGDPEWKSARAPKTWKATCTRCGKTFSKARHPAVGRYHFCRCIGPVSLIPRSEWKNKCLVWERSGVREASGKVVWSI